MSLGEGAKVRPEPATCLHRSMTICATNMSHDPAIAWGTPTAWRATAGQHAQLYISKSRYTRSAIWVSHDPETTIRVPRDPETARLSTFPMCLILT